MCMCTPKKKQTTKNHNMQHWVGRLDAVYKPCGRRDKALCREDRGKKEREEAIIHIKPNEFPAAACTHG